MTKSYLQKLLDTYGVIKNNIEERLSDFDAIRSEATEKELFIELAFCLFTPQSKAKVCWKAVKELLSEDLLFSGKKEDIVNVLNIVRFKNNKTNYLLLARDRFFGRENISLRDSIESQPNDFERREWIVSNIKGLGYKEASHFLRNIGYYENLAILDRHVLRNLVRLDVIQSIPKCITRSRYLNMEEKMKKISDNIDIPLAHVDFLLWYNETGEIF